MRIMEALRHNSDHVIQLAIQLQSLSQGICVSRKHLLPERVADYGRILISRRRVFGSFGSSPFRMHLEHRQEVSVHRGPIDSGLSFLKNQLVPRRLELRHGRKRMALPLQVNEISIV